MVDLSLGLTITEAAQALGVSKRTLERWIAANLIPVFRVGRVVRVPADAVVRFREASLTEAPPRAHRRAHRRRPGQGRPVPRARSCGTELSAPADTGRGDPVAVLPEIPPGVEIRQRHRGPVYRVRIRRHGHSLSAEFRSLEEAAAWRVQCLRSLRAGLRPITPIPAPVVPQPVQAPHVLGEVGSLSVEAACRTLIRGIKEGSVRTKQRAPFKPSVLSRYESLLRVHALDPVHGIGHLALDEITPADARQFIDALAVRTSVETARKTLMALKVVGRLADENPFASVTAPQSAEAKRPIRVLTPPEAQRIRDAAQQIDTRFGHSRAYPLISLSFLTGPRLGEALALTYGPTSLDLDSGVLHVRHALGRTRSPGGTFPLLAPKSRASVRSMEIPPSLITILKEHRRVSEHRLAGGHPPDGAFVFADRKGDPLCAMNVAYRDWRRAIDLASIPEPRPRLHDARHYWTVAMLRAGLPAQVVARLGGWSSVKLVLDTYGRHAYPAEFTGTGAALDAYLAAQS
jgi:integrase